MLTKLNNKFSPTTRRRYCTRYAVGELNLKIKDMILTIKASFADCIERAIFYKNVATPSTLKEISFDSEDTEKDIIRALQNSKGFYIEGDYIYITVERTEEEIQQLKDSYKRQVASSIAQLKNWCLNKEEDKIQILTYLEAKKLYWIIKELN